MSFLNPNYTEPCLSWSSSPFTPAAWRAHTFQSSSPQINWVFFSSHLLTSFGSQRLSLVGLRLLEDGETVMHQTAGMSFGDSVLSALPFFFPLPSLCAVSCEEIHMADQSLTETDKHLWIDNYTVFIIPNVWTVATVSVLAAPAFKNWLAFSEGMKGDYAGNVTKSLTEGFGQFVSWLMCFRPKLFAINILLKWI